MFMCHFCVYYFLYTAINYAFSPIYVVLEICFSKFCSALCLYSVIGLFWWFSNPLGWLPLWLTADMCLVALL